MPPPPHPHPFPQPPPPFFPFLPPLHTPPSFPLCFPPQFGFYPYPFFPPTSLPISSPLPQQPNQTKLPNFAPAPLAIPNIPTIKISQNLHSTAREHGGSKRSFCIDAKFFSLSFDWGAV